MPSMGLASLESLTLQLTLVIELQLKHSSCLTAIDLSLLNAMDVFSACGT